MHHYEDSLNCNQCGGEHRRTRHTSGAGHPDAGADAGLVPGSIQRRHLELRSDLSVVRTYTIGIGDFPNQYRQPKYGAWAQDDWRISDKLTLNLGLRYDLSLNSFGNDVGLEYKAGSRRSMRRADRTTPTTSSRGLGSRIR